MKAHESPSFGVLGLLDARWELRIEPPPQRRIGTRCFRSHACACRLEVRSPRAAQGCTALTLQLYLPRTGSQLAQYKLLHQAGCRPLGGIDQQIVERKTYATI